MTQPELMQHDVPKASKKLKWYIERVWSIQVFRPALVEGLICYGPERSKKATFVRVDQWLPEQKKVDEPDAKKTLLRRYLSAYGPATVRDFCKWSGIPKKESQEVWRSLQEELVEVTVDSDPSWLLEKDYEEYMNSDPNDHVLRLLPHFDPYLLGHADKNHLLNSANYKRVYRAAGWISPVVLLNGRVVGTWSYTRRGKSSFLEVKPFEKFSRIIQNKIKKEAVSLAAFLETPVEIKFCG